MIDRFEVTAVPRGKVEEYGVLVPVDFTVTSRNSVPVFVERVESKAGRRQELVNLVARPRLELVETGDDLALDPGAGDRRRVLARSGLLLPGQSLTFRAEYRLLVAEDQLLFTLTPVARKELVGLDYLPVKGEERWTKATEAGLETFAGTEFPPVKEGDLHRAVLSLSTRVDREPDLAAAKVRFEVPLAPFDPKLRPGEFDAYTWCTALGGFVVQMSPGSMHLKKKEETVPLPSVPFEFLDAVDAGRSPRVLLYSGDVRRIGPADLLPFLKDLLDQGRELGYSDDLKKARYAVLIP